MPFVSVTRLRIRSVRFMPSFVWHTLRSLRQVKHSPGFKGGSLLLDRHWTFWTMTAWDKRESMKQYMMAESHRVAMPHLLNWCDEASVVHWEEQEDSLPTWTDADRRMRSDGRASKVRYPSSRHADLSYPLPRTQAGGQVRSAGVPAQ